MKKCSAFQLLNRIIIFLIFLNFCSCNFSSKNDYEKEIKLIENIEGVSISSKTEKIFILTEHNCAPCNKLFSEFMTNNIENPNFLFIINASGNVIDISTFKKANSSKIVITNLEEEFFTDTKLIKLKNKEIDTIIKISSENIFDVIKS